VVPIRVSSLTAGPLGRDRIQQLRTSPRRGYASLAQPRLGITAIFARRAPRTSGPGVMRTADQMLGSRRFVPITGCCGGGIEFKRRIW
jgi:hypothetical protein